MANKVMISCDSTADLSPELLSRFAVDVCPQPITIEDRTLFDMVDVTPDDIFEYTAKTGKLAKTSAMNTAGFIDFFTPRLETGCDIVHFNISAEMSAAHNNCKMAAAELAEKYSGSRVYAVDSRNLSSGIGLLVLKSVRMRDEGKSAEEIAEFMREYALKPDVSFVVDRLDFLHKGGRCSSVAALGANLLKLKPCIEVSGGKMDVGRKYRGKQSAVLLEYVENRLADPENICKDEIFITHSGSSAETVELVREKILSLVPFENVYETTAGCSVSVHCGKNTLGILFVRNR